MTSRHEGAPHALGQCEDGDQLYRQGTVAPVHVAVGIVEGLTRCDVDTIGEDIRGFPAFEDAEVVVPRNAYDERRHDQAGRYFAVT